VSSGPLTPVSALAGAAVPGRFGRPDGAPGVVIAERVGLGLATLAARKGQAGALAAAVQDAYGVDLPESSVVAQGPAVSFIGQGPGQWLAVSETLPNDALARDLSTRLQGLASISDQSNGRTVLRLSGACARDVLAKGLPIDLHPRVFVVGSAATSAIGHMGVQLWQVDDLPTYDIAALRSVSLSFWRWLTASAAEFGYEVAAGRD
jgi:heterotetrameric sarcosine oxidase gamma subunit